MASRMKTVTLTCAHCQQPFLVRPSHAHLREHCSMACRVERKMRGQYYGRRAKQVFRGCIRCGKEFRVYPSTTRRFCTYECHLASGGAFRAGMAAKEAIVRYGAKKDANHGEILGALDRLGIPYIDLSTMGRGVPDLLACIGSEYYFIEIKNPKTGYGKRGLNPLQKKWADQWQGCAIYILRSVEDAEKLKTDKIGELERIECGADWKVNGEWPSEKTRNCPESA